MMNGRFRPFLSFEGVHSIELAKFTTEGDELYFGHD